MLADENILDDDLDNDSLDFTLSHGGSSLDLSTPLPFTESPSFSNISQLLTEKIQIVNAVVENDDGHRKIFEAEENLKQNEGAWGDHLKKRLPKVVQEKPKSPLKLFEKLKDKLLPALNFKKRHPKKSFTKSRSLASQSSDCNSEKEQFPDFETVLRQKSQKEALKTVVEEGEANVNDGEKTMKPLQLDAHWLDRISADCVASPSTNSVTPAGAIMEFDPLNKATSFGISKLALSNEDNKAEDNGDSDHSVISNSEDESTAYHAQILKRRRISHIEERVTKSTNPETQEIRVPSTQSPEPMNTSTESRRSSRVSRTSGKYFERVDSEADPFAVSSGGEDFVPSGEEDYDDEEEEKSTKGSSKREKKEPKPAREKKTKAVKEKKSPATGKRKSTPRSSKDAVKPSDDGPQKEPEEYLPPIDVLTDVVPRLATKELKRNSQKFYDYLVEDASSSSSTAAKADGKVEVPVSLAERKANEAKERLLKKIAGGTLNENFVRNLSSLVHDSFSNSHSFSFSGPHRHNEEELREGQEDWPIPTGEDEELETQKKSERNVRSRNEYGRM